MDIYYLKFIVNPTLNNERFNDVQGAEALCWVKEQSEESAYRKAIFFIQKYDWTIADVEIYSTLVTAENFKNKIDGLQNYFKAQREGISIVYVAWARDGKSSQEAVPLNSSLNFNLQNYLAQVKKNKQRGRCLHFESGTRCNKISKAHSIQEKQMLSVIQRNGKVYSLDISIRNLKRNNGQLSYELFGIKDFSTFRGFCEKHDTELFKSIDTQPLIPTDQQIFLYAYRSLCKGLFDKENSFNVYSNTIKNNMNLKVVNALLRGMARGTQFSLDILKTHKKKYDDDLKHKRYERIKYALFITNEKPNIVFSGGIFPDFDFLGNQLQNLYDYSSFLELITFCSVPLDTGWGFLFAWHESSSHICNKYISTLATAIYKNNSAEDFLFHLAITTENHAFSPIWWDSLDHNKKNQIIEKTSETINIFSRTPSNYLTNGTENLSAWKFDSVLTNY